MMKNCHFCRKELKISNRRFCSLKCHYENNKKIGYRPPSQKGKTGNKSHLWIGDKVGYKGLHLWVTKQLGKPRFCEHCGNRDLPPRHYHWANKSRTYKRIINDWIRLCAKCHKAYDKIDLE